MSRLRSSRRQARVAFCLVTGFAVAVSLMILDLAPRFGALAEEIAIVPLFLTAWIGSAVYRRRFGGREWQRRVAIAMAVSGALGGIAALIAMVPWTDWPSPGTVALWTLALMAGSALFGACTVPLMWLADRRLFRIRHVRRHRTSGTHHSPIPPEDTEAGRPRSQPSDG